MTTRCDLMQPGQPCSKWATPPLGVCSREGGERICGGCFRERIARLIQKDHDRIAAGLHAERKRGADV